MEDLNKLMDAVHKAELKLIKAIRLKQDVNGKLGEAVYHINIVLDKLDEFNEERKLLINILGD